MMAAQERLDMDLLAEAELTRLQRQYRIMEGDRKAFLAEIKNKLTKQQKELNILVKERDELLNDYTIATCENQKKKDAKNQKVIEKLLDEYEGIVEKNKKMKTQLEELRQQIRKFEKKLEKERLKQMTEYEYETQIKSATTMVQTLENRLDTFIKRFCTILSQNQKLRIEIDHLLKERSRYNEIWENLINKLNYDKRLMLDLIEQAILAYDQREEWCSKLQALTIRAHNDTICHTQEMREMQRQLDQYGNLKEFLVIKGQKRINRDLEEKELKRKEDEKQEFERQQKVLQETIDKIKQVCDEDDSRKIASKFIKQDEENFALFNYINEINQELEVLKETIQQLEERIEEQRENAEKQKKKEKDTLESLELKFKAAIQLANEEEARTKQEQDELQFVLEEIKKIFDLLECDATPILDLLGKDHVDNRNVMIYLGLIQKKIVVLFDEDYFKLEDVGTIKTKKSRR